MADVVIFHNPNCSTSKHAVAVANDLGVGFEERRYMLVSQRPTRDEIVELLGRLEDPATDLGMPGSPSSVLPTPMWRRRTRWPTCWRNTVSSCSAR